LLPKSCFSTLGCHDYPLERIIGTAKKFSVGSLEFRGIGGILDNRKIPEFSSDKISGTRRLLGEAGIKVACIGTSCSFHDPSKLSDALDGGIFAASAAASLGCPYIRVFGNRITGDREEGIRRVADGIAALMRNIEGTGVTVLLEVHGDFNTRDSLSAVADRLSGGRFGLIWDVAHTDPTYGDGWESFLDEFFPLVRHVHIKDLRRGGGLCLPGDGDLDIRGMISSLARRSFDGCCSLEWERKWHPEIGPVEEALSRFVSYRIQ
jgi:sugar phosphate isomerase/epimerase